MQILYNTLDNILATRSLTSYLASGEESLRLEIEKSCYSIYAPSTSKTPSHDADASQRLLESNAYLVALGGPGLPPNASRRNGYIRTHRHLFPLSPSATSKQVTVHSSFAMHFFTSLIVLVPLVFSVVALPASTQEASAITSGINAIVVQLATDAKGFTTNTNAAQAQVSQLKFTLRSILPILIPSHV